MSPIAALFVKKRAAMHSGMEMEAFQKDFQHDFSGSEAKSCWGRMWGHGSRFI